MLPQFAALAFPALISPTYVAMFEDFGAELPGLTRLVIQGWFPLLGLALVAGLLVLGLVRAMSVGKRRAVIVGGFLLALAWMGLCWLGLYQPIFDLAGAIQA